MDCPTNLCHPHLSFCLPLPSSFSRSELQHVCPSCFTVGLHSGCWSLWQYVCMCVYVCVRSVTTHQFLAPATIKRLLSSGQQQRDVSWSCCYWDSLCLSDSVVNSLTGLVLKFWNSLKSHQCCLCVMKSRNKEIPPKVPQEVQEAADTRLERDNGIKRRGGGGGGGQTRGILMSFWL